MQVPGWLALSPFLYPALSLGAQGAGASSRQGSSGCRLASGPSGQARWQPYSGTQRARSELKHRQAAEGAGRPLTVKSWKPVREKVPSSSSRIPARSIAPPLATLRTWKGTRGEGAAEP